MNKTYRYARCDKIAPKKLRESPIHVVGCGSTGSWIVLTLVKMGFENVSVCDFDIVENHNIASQVFDESHIGMKKVEAMRQIATSHNSEVEIKTIEDPFVSGQKNELFYESDLVFLSVDSMDVRMDIFKDLDDGQMYIDTKMSGAFYEIINGIKGIDDNIYKNLRWFPPEEATETGCGTQASAFNSLLVAGRAVSYMISMLQENAELPKCLSDCSINHIIQENFL